MKFKLEKVLERDIDLLIINQMINGNLLNLFLKKINISEHSINSIEHSNMDNELGESDITIIISDEKKRIGLLIEDKIDAPAMDLQPERYIERGKKGILDKKYDDFKVFIIAPQKYLDTDSSAKKYEVQISYEELLKELSNDLYAKILLEKAIEEKEKGYIIIENEMVTNFWKNYYAFIRNYYPQIKIHEINGPRGSNASWPELHTDHKKVKIIHKADRGYMDLTFSKMADYINVFNKYIKQVDSDFKIVETGKSLAVRLEVPKIDFKGEFDDYIEEMHDCMKSALKLYNLLSKINVIMMYDETNKK